MTRYSLVKPGLVVLALLLSAVLLLNGAKADPLPSSGPLPFPDSTFYRNVSAAPLHANNAQWQADIAGLPTENLFNAGYWNGEPNGFRPYRDTIARTTPIPVDVVRFPQFTAYTTFPYNPNTFQRENNPDRHLSALIDNDLYEAWHADVVNGRLVTDSTAKWDVTSNDMPPQGWGAADAAGLPLYPLLYRAGLTHAHAGRITLPRRVVSSTHVWPAVASDGSGGAIPMGTRVRLNANYVLNCSCPQAQSIVQALKTYGAFLADTATDEAIGLSGEWSLSWDTADLHELRTIPASAWEFIDNSVYMIVPTSYKSN